LPLSSGLPRKRPSCLSPMPFGRLPEETGLRPPNLSSGAPAGSTAHLVGLLARILRKPKTQSRSRPRDPSRSGENEPRQPEQAPVKREIRSGIYHPMPPTADEPIADFATQRLAALREHAVNPTDQRCLDGMGACIASGHLDIPVLPEVAGMLLSLDGSSDLDNDEVADLIQRDQALSAHYRARESRETQQQSRHRKTAHVKEAEQDRSAVVESAAVALRAIECSIHDGGSEVRVSPSGKARTRSRLRHRRPLASDTGPLDSRGGLPAQRGLEELQCRLLLEVGLRQERDADLPEDLGTGELRRLLCEVHIEDARPGHRLVLRLHTQAADAMLEPHVLGAEASAMPGCLSHRQVHHCQSVRRCRAFRWRPGWPARGGAPACRSPRSARTGRPLGSARSGCSLRASAAYFRRCVSSHRMQVGDWRRQTIHSRTSLFAPICTSKTDSDRIDNPTMTLQIALPLA